MFPFVWGSIAGETIQEHLQSPQRAGLPCGNGTERQHVQSRVQAALKKMEKLIFKH